jgi:hypothetical protein
MRIGTIRLQDFGPYEDAEVVFDQPLSLLRGDNAKGKTKLAQGIQLSFTTQCQGVTSNGVGGSDKIRLGAEKAILTTGLETAKGPMQLVTSYGPGKKGRYQEVKPGIGGDDESLKGLGEGFARYLDVSGERFSCVLDSEYFINQKPPEQKAILAALVLPTSHEFEDRMKALAEKHLGTIDWTKNPVAIIDWIYGDDKRGAFGLRKTAKATLAGIRVPVRPEKPEFDAKHVQATLADLRAKHTKEAKKVTGGGTTQVGRIEQSLTQEKEKLTTAQGERSDLFDKIAAIDAQLLDNPTVNKHKKVAANRVKYDEIGLEVAAAQSEIAAQKLAQEIFSELLQGPDGKPAKEAECPTCHQKITAKFVAGMIADHKKLENEAIAEQTRLMRAQADLGDIAGAEAAVKRQDEKLAEKLAAQRDRTANEEKLQTIEGTIARLEGELGEAKEKQTAPPDTTQVDALAAQITEWEAKLGPAVQYETTMAQIETEGKRQDEQQTKVQELETLCTHFGPGANGIKGKLVQEHIGAFSDVVNGVLGKWGYVARLSIDPYEFDVLVPGKPGYLPLKELSGFERKAFAVALQTAIAVFSKIGVILVDAADVMIAQQRNRLLGTLKLLLDDGTLKQALVMIADTSREVPQKEGVAVYFVDDGKVERL